MYYFTHFVNPAVNWVYPPNCQFHAHIKEFMTGYRSSSEAVQIKFPRADSTRVIRPNTVGYNDGQLKVLSMVGLTLILHELDTRQILIV